MKKRTIANVSGYNGDELDPCPTCGEVGGCVHSDSDMDSSYCEQLAVQIVSLTAQIEALAVAVVNLTTATAAPAVVVRQVCSAADGVPVLAYDVIPDGASSASDVTTFYRPYPADEGECAC